MRINKRLLLIILTFFILSSTLSLITRPTGDGAWHFSVIRFIAENHNLPTFEPLGRSAFLRPPLYHLVSSFFYALLSLININLSETFVKLLSPIFGSVCLLFIFLIVKKLFGEKIAIYSTLFVAFLPLYFFVSVRTMPTMLGVCLTTIAVYCALEKKILLSGLFTGLSVLAKEQSILIILPIFFIISINKKRMEFFKKAFGFLLIAFLVSAPYGIRTLILNASYKQEVLNMATLGRTSLSISNVLNPEYSILLPYLEFFGVPHTTSTSVLFFFNIPFLKPLLVIWFVSTIIYILPLLYGFYKINKSSLKFKLISIWFCSFLLFIIIFLFIFGNTIPGYLLSGIPAIAMFWGFGFCIIIKKFKRFEKLILLIYILIIAGFVSSAAIKNVYTNNAYQFYQRDYDWITANIPETAVVYFNDQSLTYNTRRLSRFFSNISDLKQDFILVNQNYMLNSGLAVLPENIVIEIKNSSKFILVYSNNVTNSTIYRISE